MKACSRLGLVPGGACALRPAIRPMEMLAPREVRRGCLIVAASCFDLKDKEDAFPNEKKRRRFSRRTRSLKRDYPDPAPQPGPEDPVELVELCIGGRTVVTTRSTLLQVPGSVLHELFCKENLSRLPRSSKGEIFLDYEPDMFGLVLRFLRELKMGGMADPSLSSFRQEDRPHLLVMLRHLRLLPMPGPLQRQHSGVTHPDASFGTNRSIPSSILATTKEESSAQTTDSQNLKVQQQQQQQQQQQHWSAALHAPRGQQHWPQDQQPRSSEAQLHQARAPSPPLVPSKSPSTAKASRASHRDGGNKQKHAKSGGSGNAHLSNHKDQPVRLVAPPVPRPVSSSQLYYIQAQYEERRGIKISVYTESDLQTLAMTEPFDVFCDATASEGQLSFTCVCRQEFDNMFIGITTRSHTDRKGSQVPCFGWKRTGCIYSGTGTRGGGPEEQWCPLPASTSSSSKAGAGRAQGGSSSGNGSGNSQSAPLWGKGDSVELIVSLGDIVNQPRMVLKVNGKQLDHIAYLPPLRSWSWYAALYMGSDMSCVTFMSDSYAVFWGDYQVKRFLS